jgi:hypothetical protein
VKNHVWRPLYLALFLAAVVLLVRHIIVPRGFGIHERGYMYGWHRLSNEAEWKAFRVKYKTASRCKECHPSIYSDIKDSVHGIISCENCHGPNYDHPKDPIGYTIDRSRKLCIRCHSRLPYPNNIRGGIRGIIPEEHYPQAECVMCHYPHNPKWANSNREVRP